MAGFVKNITAGTQNAWLSFLDFEGFCIGDSPTAMVAGESRGSYPFIGIQQMPSGIPEGEVVPVEGDDTVLGSFIFASGAPREFLINFGQGDLTLDSYLQSTLVTSEGRTKVGLVDPVNPVYPTVALLVQARAITRDPSAQGQSAWMGYLYPAVQIEPLGRETFQGRTAGGYRYKGVAQAASHLNWGVTFNPSVHGDSGAYAIEMNSYNPLTMDAFMSNGILTSWTLNKTPVVTAPTTDATRPYVERVLVTPSSVTASTKIMVLPSAYTSGNRIPTLYEYAP